MAPQTPRQMQEDYKAALDARDLDAAMALYEPTAVFVQRSGEAVHGVEAIRPLQAAFLALDPTFTHEIVGVVEGDGVAIVKTDWHMRLPDGGEQSGRSADIVRRQPDGSWLLAIDDPWARG